MKALKKKTSGMEKAPCPSGNCKQTAATSPPTNITQTASSSTKKSYSINKEFAIDTTKANFQNSCVDVLKKFSYSSPHFAKFYINGKVLYHETAGVVYEFASDNVREILSYPSEPLQTRNIRHQQLKDDVSNYVLWRNYLFEFIINDKSPYPQPSQPPVEPVLKVIITWTEFNPSNGKVVDRNSEMIEFDYNVAPYTLLVDNCVVISKECTFHYVSHYNAWDVNPQEFSFVKCRNKVRSIIYKLDERKYLTVQGTIDFRIVSGKFAVVFTGKKFTLVDIRTGEEKFNIISGYTVREEEAIFGYHRFGYQIACVENVILPLRISESQKDHHEAKPNPNWIKNDTGNGKYTSANAFEVFLHKNNGEYNITQYLF